MGKKIRRSLAWFLALVMCAGMLQLSAFASGDGCAHTAEGNPVIGTYKNGHDLSYCKYCNELVWRDNGNKSGWHGTGTYYAPDKPKPESETRTEPVNYTLTIEYVCVDGPMAGAAVAPDYTTRLAPGAEYDVKSPVVDGYAAESGKDYVKGYMGMAGDTRETVKYYRTYLLVIHYVDLETQKSIAPDHVAYLQEGEGYRVPSPKMDGYTMLYPEYNAVVTGIMSALNMGGGDLGGNGLELWVDYAPIPRQVTITLSYDANGGEGAPESETRTVNAGESAGFTVSDAVPTKEGFTFRGWQKGTKVVSGEIGIDRDTTLYAKWEKTPVAPPEPPKPVKYTLCVNYYVDDALVDTRSIALEAGGILADPAVSRPGCELVTVDGWSAGMTMPEENAAISVYYKTTPPTPEEPEVRPTVIRQWLDGYSAGTGNLIQRLELSDDVTFEAPADPTRDGYTFSGWSEAVESTNVKGQTVFTYTARWVEKEPEPTQTPEELVPETEPSQEDTSTPEESTEPVEPDEPGEEIEETEDLEENDTPLAGLPEGIEEETEPSQEDTSTPSEREPSGEDTTTIPGDRPSVEDTPKPSDDPEPVESDEPGEETEDLEDLEENDTPLAELPQEPIEETEDLEENDAPLAGLPEESIEETEDLEENDAPLAELPDEPGEELDENDVPLADVPQTGDSLWLWVILAALSVSGLAWLALSGKKGRREA